MSFTEFLPLLSLAAVLALAAVVPCAVLLLRWLMGPANAVSRRWSLWTLRGAIMLVVLVVLANPVRVDKLPGPVERPEMFYLLDTSASMRLGSPESRWQQSLALIDQTRRLVPQSPVLPKAFRFGQRLAAIGDLSRLEAALDPSGENQAERHRGRSPQSGATNSASDAWGGLPGSPVQDDLGRSSHDSSAAAARDRPMGPLMPTDADTRLVAALRQISSRFGRVPPLGVVVLSDGRAHDEADLDQLAAEFARLKVPIHVAPIGDTTKGGDIAVAAVVAPPRARKFTEIEVQVFLRSYGYDGKRAEVQLLEVGDGNRADRQLAPPLPITLQSGFQSVSLSFRTELSTRKLRVAVPPLADEVSSHNNQIETEMAIDRTKLRVLYIEGSPQPFSMAQVGGQYQVRGPFTDFKQALTEDEDIECVVLARRGGLGRLLRVVENGQVDGVHGFPATVAELAAFDAIVLSNVPADAFTEQQMDWFESWIGQRGGGLCMIGGENSFASGGWADSPLAAMLPVEMLPGAFDWQPGEAVQMVPELPAAPHALWNLVADAKLNRQIVSGIPAVTGVNRWAGARENLTTVLATATLSGGRVAQDGSANEGFRVQGSGFSIQESTQPAGTRPTDNLSMASPMIVAGRYGRGRTAALAFAISSPHADELVQRWGSGDNRYYGKLCRNLVYWLTENSAIGRRRLVAGADKRFYRPGETIAIQATTYDESAAPTNDYRVVAMVEPHAAPGEAEPETSPLRWPSGMPRTSGEEEPNIVWGEEFELPLGEGARNHSIELPLADVLSSGASSQSLRVELTAYEDLTQIDSTSLDIQVLHDPFEQQNPFPNHPLLERLAAGSGGRVLHSADDLAELLRDAPVDIGPPIIRRAPLWSNVWVWGLLIGLLTIEWCWRRKLGLA